SFRENSEIKAKYYAEKTDLLALADDSGLCVELIDNMPGIYSARWAINHKTTQPDFNFAFEKIRKKLTNQNIDLQKTKIKAHFICSLSIYDPKTKIFNSFEGKIEGRITYPPRGNNGFGYDPIFIPEGYNQTFAEMES